MKNLAPHTYEWIRKNHEALIVGFGAGAWTTLLFLAISKNL
jgi:hypothetical protein